MTQTPPSPCPKARKPRGFEDRLAARLATEQSLIKAVCAVYKQWGYDALDTGPFEYADALGQFLPDHDRPNAGVFSLMDDDGQWMALRYDHTAPLARYVAENRGQLPKPFKRYAYGPVWRNEKPGPFRFREFTQCDADAIGVSGVSADAEMCAMACDVMQAVGCDEGQYCIRVNTRRFTDALLNLVGANNAEQRLIIMRALDKLDRLGEAGVRDLLGKGRRDESGDFTQGAQLQTKAIDICLEFLSSGQDLRADTLKALSALLGDTQDGQAGLEELTTIEAILAALGKTDSQIRFDPSVVRGLDYYTGPVFEAEWIVGPDDKNTPRAGSVGGGGRYDDLITRFGADPIPATGFSVGISRIAALMTQADSAVALQRNGPVIVLALDIEHMPDYSAMAAQLRAAGVRAEVYLGGSGMRAQMKYADRRNSPAVIIVGEDERTKGIVTIKDLQAGLDAAKGVSDNAQWRRERPGQFTINRAEMVSRIQTITGAWTKT